MIFNNKSIVSTGVESCDSISLSGIDTIVIRGSSENIRIMKSSNNELNAELSGTIEGFDSRKPIIQIKKSGSTIVVEVKRPKFQLFSRSNLVLDIYISENFDDNLTLDLSSGSLEVIDSFDVNKLGISISSGFMTINEIVSVKTKVNISSGHLLINDFKGDLNGKISSGYFVVEYPFFNHDIKFNVSSGSVEIKLPEESDFELSALRSSGSINTEFELKDSSKSHRKIEGIAGNGGNKIDFKVSSGNVSINKK